jgi:hypothetical protein
MEPLAPISFSQVMILMAIFLAAMVLMFITLVLVLRRRQTKAVKFDAIHINDLIKLILSMGSFVMVLITLVFLVFQNRIIVAQTRYASQSVESNVYSTVTSQNLGTDELFLKYPELRPYFYGGKQLNEDDPHSAMALAAAEYLLDNYDAQMMQLKKYPGLWRSEKGSWEANISDMFAWSPLLCRFLEAHAAWYDDDLMTLKKAGEQKRDQGGRQQILIRQQPKTP